MLTIQKMFKKNLQNMQMKPTDKWYHKKQIEKKTFESPRYLKMSPEKWLFFR